MPTLAGRETRGAGRALALDHGRRTSPFGAQPFHLGEALLEPHRAAVGAHALLRKARDLVCERLRGRATLAVRHEAFDQADTMTLLRLYLAPGEDHVERPAPPADARQPHRAAVDPRHAPAPPIAAHVGAL